MNDPPTDGIPPMSDAPPPPSTPDASTPDQQRALASVRSLSVTLTVIGAVVLPVIFFALGAFGTLGYCYDGCTETQQIIYVAVFLVPVALYVLLAYNLVRKRRERILANPSDPGLSTAGLVWAGILAVVLILMAGVVTCFAAIGAAGGM